MTHETRTMTLGEIINRLDSDDCWYEVMGIDIAGLDAALRDADADDFDAANQIEAAYIQQHENDVYEVSWPEHVTVPRLNSDADYRAA